MTRDPRRSYESLDEADLARLGRCAHAEVEGFFSRNAHLAAWRDRQRFVALIQGAADHYVHRQRGVWDLDVAVFYAQLPGADPRPYLRRAPRAWDWGPSKFGRCPIDPPEYTGRPVDVMLWVIPEAHRPLDGLVRWLNARKERAGPKRSDLAREPVVLIEPHLGQVVWDPQGVPAPRTNKGPHRPPVGLAPP